MSAAGEAEPLHMEPIGHRDGEAAPREPACRLDPEIRDRPLDERFSWPMAGRLPPMLHRPDLLRREPKQVQIERVGFGFSTASHHYLTIYYQRKQRRIRE